MSSSNNHQHIVVLGGGYGGALAALRLARQTSRFPVKITLVDANEALTERIRLHQVAAGQPVKRRLYKDLFRNTSIEFVQARVSALDPIRRIITIQRGGENSLLRYDRLIYALGSLIDTRSVPGVSDHAFILGSMESASRLNERLITLNKIGGKLLVCGGGLTGIEGATEMAESYPNVKVKLITSDRFGSGLSETARRHLKGAFERLGIEVADRASIVRVEKGSALIADGGRVEYDVCLWAGSFMTSDIAKDAGLTVNDQGRIIVDSALRSVSHKEIYGVGDSAIIAEGPALRMACATALPMGAHAADNLSRELRGEAPKAFSFAFAGQCISLGRRDAIIQLVEEDDAPKEKILKGRLGSIVKELICRYAVWFVEQERSGWIPYRWPKAKRRNFRILTTENTERTETAL